MTYVEQGALARSDVFSGGIVSDRGVVRAATLKNGAVLDVLSGASVISATATSARVVMYGAGLTSAVTIGRKASYEAHDKGALTSGLMVNSGGSLPPGGSHPPPPRQEHEHADQPTMP